MVALLRQKHPVIWILVGQEVRVINVLSFVSLLQPELVLFNTYGQDRDVRDRSGIFLAVGSWEAIGTNIHLHRVAVEILLT